MADAKSDYLERKTLDHNLGTATFTKPTSVYVALHIANPTDAQSSTEVTGGSYARKVSTFTAAATTSGTTSATNTADLVWTNLPSATLTHVSVWDALSGGNMLYSTALSSGKVIGAGDGYTISTGQLVVTES